jgi:transcriptional regulator of acetoin/glycerol metabolism
LRPFVRESWARAIAAHVEPGLQRAPLVASPDALRHRREGSPWLRVAEDEARRQTELLADSGHILSLFDGDGQMVFADGDPHILDAMQEIHFMPGALWSEAAVGTNGPGTALSLGRPVHVVGAEHFCAGWQSWHCAALPLRDPVNGEIVGAIDLSGARERAHPLALRMAVSIGRAIEKAIEARSLERQIRLVMAYAEITARYPGQPVVVVDPARRVVIGSPALPKYPPRAMWGPGAPAILEEIAVRDAGQLAGLCLVLETHGRARPSPPAVPRRAGPPVTRYRLSDLTGSDPRLIEARRLAGIAAGNDLPVFIAGESGVGKEVVAQAIHAASARAPAAFVAVNCAAIPKDLLASELFGYVGGAFSGARTTGSPGKIEAADRGTLFLDEVLELSCTAQAALLRVLQEAEVTRVGAVRAQSVDVRVIAATNLDVAEALASGALRRDFYHRLNVLSIALPALRDRGADLPLLIGDLLAQAGRELGAPAIAIAPDALAALRAHSWPGNVRELKNLCRRLVATARGARIELADLPDELRARPPVASGATGETDRPDARIIAVVRAARTMAEAADRLGMDRSTLYRRLAKYGLRRKKTFES